MPARTYAASCVIDIALSCACSVPELPTHDTRAHGRRLLGLLTRVSFPLSLPGGQAPPLAWPVPISNDLRGSRRRFQTVAG